VVFNSIISDKKKTQTQDIKPKDCQAPPSVLPIVSHSGSRLSTAIYLTHIAHKYYKHGAVSAKIFSASTKMV